MSSLAAFRTVRIAGLALLAVALHLGSPLGASGPPAAPAAPKGGPTSPVSKPETSAIATFAAGCFWCVEAAFEKVEGVLDVVSGYTGGERKNPTYEEVSSGGTGHAEAVRVTYDPKRVSYERLLYVFWRNVDPTTPNRQFCDVGEQYRGAIFVHDAMQRAAAEASKREIESSHRFAQRIATEIADAGPFYPAEGYHQDYAANNPVRYSFYKSGCRRSARLTELWGTEAEAH